MNTANVRERRRKVERWEVEKMFRFSMGIYASLQQDTFSQRNMQVECLPSCVCNMLTSNTPFIRQSQKMPF
jgi:hypothetical protein